MKFILKYAFLAALTLLIACGNVETEKKSDKTSTTVKAEPTNSVKNKTTAVKTPTIDKEVKQDGIDVTKPTPIKTETPPKVVEKDVSKTVKTVNKKESVKKTESVKTETSKPTEMPTTPPVQSKEVSTEIKKEVKAEAIETATSKTTVKETPKPKKEEIKPTPASFSHEAWNQLAQKHISSTGKVNYKGFKADLPAFEAYLKSLADNPVQNDWSRAQKMAYWINAYNAFTIKLIVDNYPISSITKLHGGKPWDVKWIKLGGETYSLNNIEHDILRPQFKDARIHFAVNCAAQSCPPVWNKAWTAQNLNGQLDRSAKVFINNGKYNAISSGEVAISKIFEWYAVDFGDSIIDYLNKYATTKINSGATVKYKDYNWALNE